MLQPVVNSYMHVETDWSVHIHCKNSNYIIELAFSNLQIVSLQSFHAVVWPPLHAAVYIILYCTVLFRWVLQTWCMCMYNILYLFLDMFLLLF